MGEIPEDMYNKITWYNKIGLFSLNVSGAIEVCMSNAVGRIEEEAVDYIKRNGGISRGYTESYNNALEGIKAGLPAYETYQLAIKDMHIQPKQHIMRSQVYLPLLPVNKMKFKEDEQRIYFFVDELFCYSITPLDGPFKPEEIEQTDEENVEF